MPPMQGRPAPRSEPHPLLHASWGVLCCQGGSGGPRRPQRGPGGGGPLLQGRPCPTAPSSLRCSCRRCRRPHGGHRSRGDARSLFSTQGELRSPQRARKAPGPPSRAARSPPTPRAPPAALPSPRHLGQPRRMGGSGRTRLGSCWPSRRGCLPGRRSSGSSSRSSAWPHCASASDASRSTTRASTG